MAAVRDVDDVVLVRGLCKKLHALSVEPLGPLAIVDSGAISPAAVALQRWGTSDDALALALCKAFAVLLCDPLNQRVLADAGVIPPLVLCAKASTCIDVCVLSCVCLGNLSLDDYNQERIHGAGGLSAALRTLETYGYEAHAALAACSCIANLSAGSTTSSATSKSIAQPLLVALSTHAHRSDIVASALKALFNVTCESLENIDTVLSGGLASISESLREFPTEQSVVEMACGVMHNICSSSEHQARFESAGGIDVLLSAARAHPENAVISQYALRALACLACRSEVARQISQAGGYELACCAIETHAAVADVLLSACGILHEFVRHNCPEIPTSSTPRAKLMELLAVGAGAAASGAAHSSDAAATQAASDALAALRLLK